MGKDKILMFNWDTLKKYVEKDMGRFLKIMVHKKNCK